MGGRGQGSGTGGGGSSSASSSGHSKALDRALSAVENSIRHDSKESMHVFDADGNELLNLGGGKTSVSFTLTEAQRFKDAVITHNHPAGNDRGGIGGTFSGADIANTFKFGASEMRAVTAEGTYVMTWVGGNGDKRGNATQIANEFNKFNQSVQSPLKQIEAYTRVVSDPKNANLTEAQIDFETAKIVLTDYNNAWRGWWKDNAPAYGFAYKEFMS